MNRNEHIYQFASRVRIPSRPGKNFMKLRSRRQKREIHRKYRRLMDQAIENYLDS